MASWRLAFAGFFLAGLVTSSCGSSPPRVAGAPPGNDGGQIVIDYGGQYDSYTEVSPRGVTVRDLGIPGYLRAGFNDTLTKVAVVRGGELNGSAADGSTIGVSTLGSTTNKVIWRFVGIVNYPLSWNPSGSELAVGLAPAIDRGGNYSSKQSPGLWVIASNGSSHRDVVQGEVGPVSWSPNGESIAFMPTPAGTLTALKVVPAAGGNPTTITNFAKVMGGSYGDPTLSWSPDGSDIAVAYTIYRSQQSTSQVTLYPANGGMPRTILGPSSNMVYTGASFSPDGAELAVTVDARPPPQPASGNTSQTTLLTTAAPPAPGQSLDIVDVTGNDLHAITHLNATALMIGWYSAP